MKAEQILDMQADLVNRYDTDAGFANLIKTMILGNTTKSACNGGQDAWVWANNPSAAQFSLDAYHSSGVYSQTVVPRDQRSVYAHRISNTVYRAAARHARMADAYRVSDEMSMLIQHMASKLESSDCLDHRMAPSPSGIVHFERPLPIKDIRGGTMLANWMTWGPITIDKRSGAFGEIIGQTEGMVFTWWNDLNTPDEYAESMMRVLNKRQLAAMRKHIGRWMLCSAEIASDGIALGGPTVSVSEETQARLLAEGATPEPYTNTQRYAHALFLLMSQTVVETKRETVPRAAHARVARAKIPGRVSVVSMRHSGGGGGAQAGESKRQWTHRWLVKASWAWRHCGPDHPLAQRYEKGYRARVLVSAYVKGPKDLPFEPVRKVYSLS